MGPSDGASVSAGADKGLGTPAGQGKTWVVGGAEVRGMFSSVAAHPPSTGHAALMAVRRSEGVAPVPCVTGGPPDTAEPRENVKPDILSIAIIEVVDDAAEQWAPVPGYEDAYEVSDRLRVRSLPREAVCRARATRRVRERILVPVPRAGTRFAQVTLCSDGRRRRVYIHAVMREAFAE